MQGSILLLTLRRLRAPLLLLVAIYAVGMTGLVLIPGIAADGTPWHMSVFQALYFMSYTASTIGFGEIPQAFTDTQRLWVTFVIYASVIGWTYSLGSLLALTQDRAFMAAIAAARFQRAVRALREPFYIICGFGETGLLLARALDSLRQRFVVVEIDQARAQALSLLGLEQDVPVLPADAALPDNLLTAGLGKAQCQGVLALTDDDQANLAVAMSVRLLNPRIPVLARAMSREAAANMASFGTDSIINPFATFGDYLGLTISSPGSYQLLSWLTGLPGTSLKPETVPPRGHWVVCGYGHFGREVVAAIRHEGMNISVIDPEGCDLPGLVPVLGRGTESEPLREAGIERAVGLVAGTDDDVTNLSIAVTARELNPELFTVLRQNSEANRALFEVFRADITMVSAQIVANECLAVLKTPRLAAFLDVVRASSDAWADSVVARLHATLGAQTPEIWGIQLTQVAAPAIHYALVRDNLTVLLGDLARDPTAREERLACVPLALFRNGDLQPLPDDQLALVVGDEILYAGHREARDLQRSTLGNANVCDYVLQGIDLPGGWVWQWWAARRGRA